MTLRGCMVMAVGLLAAACSNSHGQSSSQCGTACGENHGGGGSAVQGGNDAGVNGGGGKDSGVASGGGHDSGVAGGGSDRDAGLCYNLNEQVFQAVVDAGTHAQLGCALKSDCQLISFDIMCARGCGGDVLVSARGKQGFQAVIAELNAGACAHYADAGCVEVIPPCPPPALTSYGCVAGKCSWLDDPSRDPGSNCIVRELSWTHDGGLVAFQERHTLTPCRGYSFARLSRAEAMGDVHCANEVASDAAISIADVNAALASDDFNAALAAAPVLYGIDSRPVDGSVFRIEIDGKTIDIGGDCNAEPGCAAIPAGVSAARQVLEALTMQQRALGSCASLP